MGIEYRRSRHNFMEKQMQKTMEAGFNRGLTPCSLKIGPAY